MSLSSVDLPEPDGPNKAKNSPGSICRLISFRTSVAPYDSRMFWHSTLTFFMEIPSGTRRLLPDRRAFNDKVRGIGAYGDCNHRQHAQRGSGASPGCALHVQIDAVAHGRVTVLRHKHDGGGELYGR